MGHNYADRQIQSETIRWMTKFDGRMQLAVTLTFKDYVRPFRPDGSQGFQGLTPDLAWKTHNQFVARVNEALFGHAARRYDKTIICLPMLHGESTDKRLHLHCAIGDIPNHALAKFEGIARNAWKATMFGWDQVHFQWYRDEGWLRYMNHELTAGGMDFGWQHLAVGSQAL